MENKKGIIIGVLIGIIGALSVLLILFATGIISFKQKESDSIDNNKEKVDIKILSIDNINIEEDSPNHNMSIGGTMKLSFDQDKFLAVVLEGYCIGENNEKYMMTGPGSGEISFKNGSINFGLVNTINNHTGDVIYSDGTTKTSLEIDWKNVKIKSCTVERMVAYTSESNGNTSIVSELNFEKNFETSANGYKEYKTYDEVTLSDGSKWMVIEDSSKTQDYVTLIKKQDVEIPGNIFDKLSNEFYNGNISYDNSELKKYINSLTNTIPAKLKEVDGHKISLITVEKIMELDGNWTYDKTHDDYTYNGKNSHIPTFVGLTMTKPKCNEGKCTSFYVVGATYDEKQVATYYIDHWASGFPQIKPVINVYKTELEKK